MNVERVVLDSNVLISAAISPLGKPYACLDWILDNAILISSRVLIDEVGSRLARPKFTKYVDEVRGRAFIADLALAAFKSNHLGNSKLAATPMTTICWKPQSWVGPTAL